MSILRRPFKYRNDGVVYWIIGINVLIFAAMQLLGNDFRYFMTTRMSMIPFMVMHGWIWTFVTYMFMHGGITHILFNMLGLFIFGSRVENEIGSREFLLYYLFTGALAGIFSFGVFYFTGQMGTILLGASGALFAVELAYAVLFPDSMVYIWGILPLRAPIMVLGYTALEIVFSVTGRKDGIAHFTHLAGFGVGWIYFLVRFGVNPWRRLTRR